jgi:alpha/beta superfamily hydrolase
MDNNVVVAVALVLARNGIAALRFNFRGAGDSDGTFGGGVGEREDVIAALAFLAEQPGVDPNRLGLVGYSFGALIALGAGPTKARALVAVSPPLSAAEAPHLPPDIPVLLVTGERDGIAPAAPLTEMADSAGDRCEALVLPAADHFWWGQEGGLTEAVLRFLQRNL